jgi:hypothetical protein
MSSIRSLEVLRNHQRVPSMKYVRANWPYVGAAFLRHFSRMSLSIPNWLTSSMILNQSILTWSEGNCGQVLLPCHKHLCSRLLLLMVMIHTPWYWPLSSTCLQMTRYAGSQQSRHFLGRNGSSYMLHATIVGRKVTSILCALNTWRRSSPVRSVLKILVISKMCARSLLVVHDLENLAFVSSLPVTSRI